MSKSEKMYKFRIYIMLSILASATLVSAKGIGELIPTSIDVAAFGTTNVAVYDASSSVSGGYVKMAIPKNGQVFIGTSQIVSIFSTEGRVLLGINYYFRIKDPSSIVVFGLQLVDVSNINTYPWTLVSAGPNALYLDGNTPFIFNPNRFTAGDYYIEFRHNSNSKSATTIVDYVDMKYFDVTLTTEDVISTDLKTRVFNKNWGPRYIKSIPPNSFYNDSQNRNIVIII